MLAIVTIADVKLKSDAVNNALDILKDKVVKAERAAGLSTNKDLLVIAQGARHAEWDLAI